MNRLNLSLLTLACLNLTGSLLFGEEAALSQSQSYARFRKLAEQGRMVPPEEIRADEWINYQRYDFPTLELGARTALWSAFEVRPGEPSWSAMVMLAVKTAPYACEREQPIDLVIVLDRSGSMASDRKMDYAREGIRHLLTQLRDGDRVGLIGFDTKVYPERPLSGWKTGDDLETELKRLGPNGGTDLNLGLREGMQMLRAATAPGDPKGAPARVQRLLVITDACTNHGETDVEAIVKDLTPGFDAGVRLSCIGVGLEYHDALFSRLCRIPGNNGRFLDRPGEIKQSMDILFDSILPLELDKPVVTLDLPAHVRVTHSYGTPFEQTQSAVTLTRLTSLGCNDHEIVCLRLEGAPGDLARLAGCPVRLEGFSPRERTEVHLRSQLAEVSEEAPKDAAQATLAGALRRAGTLAAVAEEFRRCAIAGQARDWTSAEIAMKRAELELDGYQPAAADAQANELRRLIGFNRQILKAANTTANP